MENTLQTGRDFFPLHTKSKEPSITLGMSTYLIMIMAAVHITFGMLCVSENYVGNQLTCFSDDDQATKICKSKFHYLPVGHDYAVKYSKKEIKQSFAFYKLTNWIFMIIGITFVTLSYAWKKWENGQVHLLVNGKNVEVKSKKETTENADIIAHHLKNFGENNRSYFILFVLSEILNFLSCCAVLAYYFYLLKVDTRDFTPLFYNFLQDSVYDEVDIPNHLQQLFPREISCLYKTHGPSGTLQNHDTRCVVTNQEYIELLHVIAFFVSGVIVTLYIINICYLVLNFLGFKTFATDAFDEAYMKVSLNKKLIVLLLLKNIDNETHNLVMEKINSKTKSEVSSKKNLNDTEFAMINMLQ